MPPSAQPLGRLRRLAVTLDGALLVVITAWGLAMAALFASNDDPVHNQPLPVRFDLGRIAAHPLEFASYAGQFGVIAALAFVFYRLCRQLMIRRILRRHGWLAFAITNIALIALYTPLASGIILLLPLNTPEWTLLPSEDHKPFASLNYQVAFAAWIVTMPLALVFERLSSEHSAAIGSREQARAELRLLQQQINPHFLFNTLNTLYALCLTDRTVSAEAILKLSDLLRYTVYEGERPLVGLDQEIACLDNYLGLQMLRVGHRCQLHCDWPDNAARYRLPPLLLIMLVENAFKHGIEPYEGPGEVTISITLADRQMEFVCRNSIPAQPGGDNQPGIGLGNLRRRLKLLYGTGFTLQSQPDGAVWESRLELMLQPC